MIAIGAFRLLVKLRLRDNHTKCEAERKVGFPQAQHPAEFWINLDLGMTLQTVTPARMQ